MPSVAKKTKEICNHQDIEVKTGSVEFADDCSGLAATKNDHELQTAVNVMMSQYRHYFGINGLCLNENKCQVIVFRTRSLTKLIKLGDVQEVKLVKLLGLYIDNDMNFRKHSEETYNHCLFKITALKKIRPFMTETGFSKIAQALVHSKI